MRRACEAEGGHVHACMWNMYVWYMCALMHMGHKTKTHTLVCVCVRQKLAENTVVRWVGRRTCYGRVSSAAGEGGAYNTQTNIRALSFRCLSMGWSRLSPTHL